MAYKLINFEFDDLYKLNSGSMIALSFHVTYTNKKQLRGIMKLKPTQYTYGREVYKGKVIKEFYFRKFFFAPPGKLRISHV